MRYSYEFKKQYVEMYHQGKYLVTLEGIGTKSFHSKIWEWVRIEESCGPDDLHYKNHNKEWTPEEKYEELIRLRAENAYIKVENEVIKKIALREEKQAAQIKMKKQQSSKNFVKRIPIKVYLEGKGNG